MAHLMLCLLQQVQLLDIAYFCRHQSRLLHLLHCAWTSTPFLDTFLHDVFFSSLDSTQSPSQEPAKMEGDDIERNPTGTYAAFEDM